jgi:tyrosine-protein kinase Etk/Wzc
MKDFDNQPDSFQIHFSDLLLLLRRSKGRIIFWTLFCALLATLYQLIQPVQYIAEATFREKQSAATDVGKGVTLSLLMGLNDANENMATTMLKSRKLLESVIRERGLQGLIKEKKLEFQRLRNIKDNLHVEYAYLRNFLEPIIDDPKKPLQIRQIRYDAEVPLYLKFKEREGNQFEVSDRNGHVTLGEYDKLSTGSHYEFVLSKLNDDSLEGQEFTLALMPLPYVAEKMSKLLKVQTDLQDKGLLKLSYQDPNRHEACHCLNMLMGVYIDYLKNEHKRVINEQIAYLNRRQGETAAQLKEVMKDHAEAISSNMATIEFLFEQQESFSEKVLLIDLELKRLERAQGEDIAYYDQMGNGNSNGVGHDDSDVINQILREIRTCKRQCESIDLALHNMPLETHEEMEKNFSTQIAQLDEIKRTSVDTQSLIKALKNRQSLVLGPKLASHSKYLVQEWMTKLKQRERDWQTADLAQKEEAKASLDNCCAMFESYLSNLSRLLDVEKKIVEERLAHQQSPRLEFQGLDLETINQLYIKYSEELGTIEADIIHHQFILDQMKDPEFEPSSLSSVLHDRVSIDMIALASEIVLKLKDDINRSQRELERLRLDLAQQRNFLTVHVKQTLQLLELRKKLLQGKIYSIQNGQQELLQQQISVLKKNLGDFIGSRINNLKQEKIAINQQQLALKVDMEKMPIKWASEKLIDLHLETSSKIVEEITKQVEFKNISANLDLTRSSPIDIAIPSIHPKRPKLLLYFVLGGLFGAFATFSVILGKTMTRGMPATSDNIKLLDQHVAGELPTHTSNRLSKNDSETLRHLMAYLTPSVQGLKGGQTLLLMMNGSMDYSVHFARLLAKGGYRVLLLPLEGDPSTEGGTDTLMQYLQGQAEAPNILTGPDFDRIVLGEMAQDSKALLLSRRFQDLLATLQQKYDWILAVSQALLLSGEAEALFNLCSQVAITLNGEKVQEVQDLLKLLQGKKVSFILAYR